MPEGIASVTLRSYGRAIRGACLLVFLVVALGVTQLRAGHAAEQTSPAVGSWSSPTSVISPVVEASWFTSRRDGVEQLDLLVLWRGTPGWFLRAGGSGGGGGDGPGGPYQTWIVRGALKLTLDFDPSKRIAIVQGTSLDLADDNVVFMDDVDSPTGPRVVTTMRVPRAMPGSAGQIGLVLRESSEIMSFLRCDAKPQDGRGQALLERLCLQNIGIAK